MVLRTPYEQGYYDAMVKVGGYWQNVVGIDDPAQLTDLRNRAFEAQKPYDEYWSKADQTIDQQLGPRPERRKSIDKRRGGAIGTGVGMGVGGALGALGMGLLGRKLKQPQAAGLLSGGFLGALGGGFGGRAIGRAVAPEKSKVLNQAELDAYSDSRTDAYKKYREASPPPEYDPDSIRDQITTEGLRGTDLGHLGKYLDIPEMVARYQTSAQGGVPTERGYLDKEQLMERLKGLKDLGVNFPYSEDLVEKVTESPHNYFTSTEAG